MIASRGEGTRTLPWQALTPRHNAEVQVFNNGGHMETGYQAECSNRGCKNTFRVPHGGHFINFKWWCNDCGRVIQRGMTNGVTVAKQLVIATPRQRIDG